MQKECGVLSHGWAGRKTRPGPEPIFLQACVPALGKCGGGWRQGRGCPVGSNCTGGRVRRKLSVGRGKSERKETKTDKMGEAEGGGGRGKEGEKVGERGRGPV